MFEAKYHGGKSMSWKEATRVAQESIRATKAEISANIEVKEGSSIIHKEFISREVA